MFAEAPARGGLWTAGTQRDSWFESSLLALWGPPSVILLSMEKRDSGGKISKVYMENTANSGWSDSCHLLISVGSNNHAGAETETQDKVVYFT